MNGLRKVALDPKENWTEFCRKWEILIDKVWVVSQGNRLDEAKRKITEFEDIPFKFVWSVRMNERQF